MSVPQPKQALEGHCSAIHDETLYVLSPSGLQSLPLKENATWSEEPSGTSVKGAACVKAVPGGDESAAALYVIGGTTDDQSYGGLQRYHFGSKKWESLETPVDVLQGRTNHSAAYLRDSDSILIYAGSQPDSPSWLSSQTFVVHTEEPYNIDSFTSTAPPSNQPILQPLNSTHAVLAGGSSTSNGVFTFDTNWGWRPLGANLSEPLEPGVRGTIVDGSDGSKVLETYDMSVSPNTVTQTVLLGPGGQVAKNGQTLGGLSSKKRKRDLTLDNWPSYNSTGAPTAQRDDYSVAQDTDGLAVASGGNRDEPVSLFSQADNSWVDTSRFFNSDQQEPLLEPSATSSGTATSSTPTTSSEPSATSTEAASVGITPHDKMLRTLGITLGVLCGIAAVFIFALLFVRMRKAKKRKQHGYVEEDEKSPGNNRLSFADRGASFMKEAGGSVSNVTPPPANRYEHNNGSHSSLAIIGGKWGNKRHTGQQQRGSFESTTNLVKDKNGDMEMLDIGDKKHEVERKPRQSLAPPIQVFGTSPDDQKSQLNNRSSGWSRYFATSQPEGVAHLPSAYVKDRQSTASEWPSSGHASSAMSRIPSSALVPPLDIDFSKTVDGQRLSNVVKGSPAFANSEEDLARRGSPIEGHKAMFDEGDRPLSNTDTVSSYDRSTMSTDYYNGLSSGNTPWTPVSNNFKDPDAQTRPSSSLYTNSVYDPQRATYETHQRLPSRAARSQNSGFFPGAGTAVKPPKLKINHEPTPSSEWPTMPGATKDSPLLNTPPPIAAQHPAMPAPVHDRASVATVFPHNNGNRWTANVSREDMPGALQPPRAPALTGGAKPSISNDRDSTVTVFPMADGDAWTANASKTDLQPPRAPGLNENARPAADRDSTQTMFPRGVPSAYYANRPKEIEDESHKKPMDTDMSWLNLGLGGHRS